MSSLGLVAAITDCVEQAGGNVSQLKKVPAQEKSTETVEKEADAIVVGGGGAGMAAAIRLQELGKNVILVEKTYRLGGSISVSGGNQVVTAASFRPKRALPMTARLMVEDFPEER